MSQERHTDELASPAETRSECARSPHAHLDQAMSRYAQGDTAAFVTVHRGLAPRVRGFLLRLCGDRALADDLTQETFLRMHRARGTFAEDAPVVPWALAIARNTFRDRLRTSTRERRIPEALTSSANAQEFPSHEGHGEQFVIAREVAETVRTTLAALPVSQREAFVLLRFEGLSVAEAAEILGASATAVKLRAFRAYEALRASLQSTRGGRGTTV